MAPRGTYTEEELAILTPDEREALLDDSEESGENPIPSNGDGDVETKLDDVDIDEEIDDADKQKEIEADKDKDVVDDGAKEKDKDKEDADDKAKENAGVDNKGVDDATTVRETEEPKAAPVLKAEAPADAKVKLDEIVSKKSELADQFDNGDLTAKEYQTQLDALNRDERKIEQDIFKAELANELNETSAQNSWDKTCAAFVSQHSEYKPGSLRFDTLNMLVMKIAADPASESLSGRQILEKAHEAVESEFGVVRREKEADASGKGKDAGKEQGKAKEEIPPTLGKLPAAANADTETNRFSYLDRLAEKDPQKYENEFAKLSPTDRDTYLAMS